MKWKLFVCGAVLITAGCASNPGPDSNVGEFGFTYDYPAPVRTGSEITMEPSPYFINVTSFP
jgi:hypothetical protein